MYTWKIASADKQYLQRVLKNSKDPVLQSLYRQLAAIKADKNKKEGL